MKEAKQLQIILLKNFEEVAFKEGRITTNIPSVITLVSLYTHSWLIHLMTQVPQQWNSKDCGCFMIYFAKKFLSHPDAVIALIKVVLSISSSELN